jgi:hypothetical protein
MSDIWKYFTIMANDAGQEAYRDSYVHEIERQLAEMKRKYQFTYCAFCGETFEIDAPESTEAISQHIKTCDKHPMRDVERDLAAMAKQRDMLRLALKESMRYLEPALGPMGDLTGCCVDNGTWREWSAALESTKETP